MVANMSASAASACISAFLFLFAFFFYQAYIAVVEFHLSHPSLESSGTKLTNTDPDSSHTMYPFSKWSS